MTVQQGLGLCPMGLGPYGFGTPAAMLPIDSPLFVDPLGVQQTGRRIDPKTKQYTYNANGRAVGMGTGVQAMYLACKTTLGKSAIAALGNEISSVKDITPNVQNRIRAIFTKATERLVAAGVVVIRSITVDLVQLPNNGGTIAATRIKFTDITTGKPEEITLT